MLQGQVRESQDRILKNDGKAKAEATERITTDEGNILRQNRSIQVEEAFGVLKQNREFRRFFVRSKIKTETQFFLLAFAFNIKKLWNRTLDGRLGVDLFEKEAA